MSSIQEPNSRNASNSTTWFKIERGDNVFRVLPPFKRPATERSPKWAQLYKIHWGYETSTGQKKPFNSPEVYNFNSKMVEVPDAAWERISQLKNIKENADKTGDTATSVSVSQALQRYRMKKGYFLNAMDLNGVIGVLEIPKTAFDNLKLECDRIEKESGSHPAGSRNGRYFIFRKTGEGLGTKYTVHEYKQTVADPVHGKIEVAFKHDLTDEVLTRMETEARDLNALYTTPTPEQVERMVKEGSKAVDEVFGVNNYTQNTNQTPTTTAPQPTASTVPQGATAQAPQTPAPQAQTAAKPPATTGVDPATAQKNADFLKQMGF